MCQDPVKTKVPAQISSGDNRTRTFVSIKKYVNTLFLDILKLAVFKFVFKNK